MLEQVRKKQGQLSQVRGLQQKEAGLSREASQVMAFRLFQQQTSDFQFRVCAGTHSNVHQERLCTVDGVYAQGKCSHTDFPFCQEVTNAFLF